MTPALMLIALLGAHMLADYPLQQDVLWKAKNRQMPVPGIPWYHAMLAHVTIHGALAALITGLWWVFLAEAVIHFITDDAKCMGKIGYETDQAIHILCKLMWWGAAIYVV